MKRVLSRVAFPAIIFSMVSAPSTGVADVQTPIPGTKKNISNAEYASPERQEAALGHYARARALLVEALAEFEEGRATARPDMLLDGDEWRTMIVSKTEELNRLLDPQPRVSRSGVRYKANKSLIRSDRSARASMVQDSNYAGEDQVTSEMKASRTPAVTTTTTTTVVPPVVVEQKTEVKPVAPAVTAKSNAAPAKVLVSPREAKETDETISKIQKLQEEVSHANDELKAEMSDLPKADVDSAAAVKEPLMAEKPASDIAISEQENVEISQAIEDAIKARLQKVDSMATDAATKAPVTAPKDDLPSSDLTQ